MKNTAQNRWLIVVGTVIAQLGLGTIYTWSLFNDPLVNKFGWNLSEVSMTFSITSFSLAFATLFAGRLQEKIGIRKLVTICGLIMGAGLIIGSKANSLLLLYITVGFMVGAADGMAYITILSNCIKWFPEKKGIISGVSVGAYGTGSLIFKYINGGIIGNKGVSTAFVYWGMIVMTLVTLGAQFLKDATVKDVTAGSSEERNYTVREMLKAKECYMLFIVFFTACMSGLYLIGIVKDIGVKLAGLRLTPAFAANAVARVVIFNTSGRIILGALSDKIGGLRVLIFTLSLTAFAVMVLSFASLNYPIFFLCVSSIAFYFGGNITVFPPIVGEFFGLKNQTSNYGVIYQGFGIGALSGSFIASILGGIKPTFIVVGALCAISIVIVAKLKTSENNSTINDLEIIVGNGEVSNA